MAIKVTIHDELEDEKLLDDSGQTLVEFVLLLLIVMSISFVYMSVVNRGIADYWQAMGNILLKDVPQKQNLKLR
jgi:hypothetical protein